MQVSCLNVIAVRLNFDMWAKVKYDDAIELNSSNRVFYLSITETNLICPSDLDKQMHEI